MDRPRPGRCTPKAWILWVVLGLIARMARPVVSVAILFAVSAASQIGHGGRAVDHGHVAPGADGEYVLLALVSLLGAPAAPAARAAYTPLPPGPAGACRPGASSRS